MTKEKLIEKLQEMFTVNCSTCGIDKESKVAKKMCSRCYVEYLYWIPSEDFLEKIIEIIKEEVKYGK